MFDKLFLFHTSETLKQRDFQIIELKMKTEQFEAITSKSDSISNSFLTELTSPMASLDNQFFSSSTYPLTSPNSINSTSTAISSQTNSCFASAPVNVSSSSPLLSSSLSISSTLPSKPPPSSANSFSPITDSISDGPFVSALYPSLSNSLPSARLFTLNHQPSMFHANLPVAQPSCTGENDNLLLSLSGLSSSPQVVSTTITTSPIPSSQGIFDSVRLPTGWPLSTQSQSEGPSDTSASKEDNVGASEMQDNLDSLNSSSMVEEGMHVAHLPPVDSALFFPGLHQLDDRFPGPGQSHLLPNPAYTVSQGFISYHTPGPVRRPANWNSNHATATINGTPPSNNQLTPIMFNGASGEDSSVTCDDPSSPLLADLLMVKAAAGLTAVMGRCETMNSRVLSTLAAATAAAEASSSGAANIGPQAVLSNECPGSTNNTSAIAISAEGECSISPISVSRAPSNSIINHHQHQLQQAILSAPHSPGRQSRLLRLSGGSSGSCAGSGNGFSFHEEEPHDPSSFGDTPIIASVDSGLLRDPPPNKQQLPERRYQLSQSTSIGLQIPITSSLSQLSNGFLETTAISSPATDQIIEQNLSSTSFETSGLRISAPVVRLPPSSTLSSSSSVLSASTTSDVSLLTPKSSSFSSSPFLTPFTTSQVANSAFQPSTFSGDGEITFQESSAHQV
ncbi:unnamed protein product [Protopolystoma xenopodis]|uniref:Uncharacterized protein n=1 Tax=Protopolystoma xenopodis TaxID=117903 RepID=A0A448WNP1_9PLAT|nr:unnamed protein product [Protopolystoma xenopodis]